MGAWEPYFPTRLIGQCNRSICIMAMSNLTGPAILGAVIGHLHMNGFRSCLILFKHLHGWTPPSLITIFKGRL